MKISTVIVIVLEPAENGWNNKKEKIKIKNNKKFRGQQYLR